MRILIIKLSAFGDVVQTIPAMQAVRKHYPQAHISLLTTPLFVELTEKLQIFDEIIPHQRFKLHQLGKVRTFRRLLRTGKYDYVIDLQCTTRTASYFYLIQPSASKWVTVARHATISHARADLEKIKPYDRHQLLLQGFNIPYDKKVDNGWVDKLPTAHFTAHIASRKYVLLVVGASTKHPQKCWSADNFAQIAKLLVAGNIVPILIGGSAEQQIAEEISAQCADVYNLVGKTSFWDIAVLAKKAHYALGNDTGAMHLIAQMGCGCLLLFIKKKYPDLYQPPFAHCHMLQVNDLTSDELTAKMVMDKMQATGLELEQQNR